MKNMLCVAAVAVAAMIPVACNNSPPGGNTAAGTGVGSGNKGTFTIKAPEMSTTIKQGDRQTVKLSLSRGSEFKQSVKLEASAPTGLKVDLGTKHVAASDPTEFTLTIEADKTAAIGESVVKVTGTPDTGTATSVDVKVKVEEKK
ncbi:hypothetical protein [Fimbriiglobus ruber]|uniref:Lipoprotein n=1 Tax=Fimbriiglobus ruber TaxID=1908690 RepID=A0A225DMH0_9BACT|nr:hypothetical protein [Fimbriiglobus ruber]OWK39748.1 hypothetical protein FRUB_05638 [Fimbriiglobus ruber]